MTIKTSRFGIGPYLLKMRRSIKRLIVLTLDIFLCCLSVWLAFYLRLDYPVSFSQADRWFTGALIASIVAITLVVPIFTYFGLYRTIFRHNGWPAILIINKAMLIYTLLYFLIFTVVRLAEVPRTIGIIQPFVLHFLIVVSRALANIWLGGEYRRFLRNADSQNVLIYGAGQTGRGLAAAISGNHEIKVVGFLDDDDSLYGNALNGLRIYNPRDLDRVTKKLRATVVLLALPNIGRERRNQILEQMQSCNVAVRTVPSMMHLAQGRVDIKDVRDLDTDDLLGRDPVAPNPILLTKNIFKKVVLVTGAGGSIGSELCRQIARLNPRRLLLVEHSEFALYKIQQELESNLVASAVDVVPILASVQDKNRILEIMSIWEPTTVYHAAAYKHVPIVELNPIEGIRNNVFGTLHTAQAALKTSVSDFVLVSTDKAVRPTNIMGASKRIAELVLQALTGGESQTKFTMVRFGNVLGSSGSVVPKFRQQLLDGGPITLTHPDVIRYFMTIPEAAQLVIQAGAMAKGGDVFVLDMGEPVRIYDLAKRMVELSGLSVRDAANPFGDIEVKITGLRPGEKLFEEMLIGENFERTIHPQIIRAHEDYFGWEFLRQKLASLESAIEVSNFDAIKSVVCELVPGYSPRAHEHSHWISA